jgi:hypothetical protein
VFIYRKFAEIKEIIRRKLAVGLMIIGYSIFENTPRLQLGVNCSAFAMLEIQLSNNRIILNTNYTGFNLLINLIKGLKIKVVSIY